MWQDIPVVTNIEPKRKGNENRSTHSFQIPHQISPLTAKPAKSSRMEEIALPLSANPHIPVTSKRNRTQTHEERRTFFSALSRVRFASDKPPSVVVFFFFFFG